MSRRNEEKIFVNNYIPLPPDDFYTKSKLQDVLCRSSQYFANAEIKNVDIIYLDLHQKKMNQPWNTKGQLVMTDLMILTGKRQIV